jgi:hypothetical protein
MSVAIVVFSLFLQESDRLEKSLLTAKSSTRNLELCMKLIGI